MEFTRKNANKIKQLFQEISPPYQTVIEFATAKLSICPIDNNPQRKFKKIAKEGIVCVVINRTVPSLFLQLFDYLTFQKLFEIELYSNIEEGYHCSKNNLFHSIEFPGFFLGMSFVDNDLRKKSIGSQEGSKVEGENSASIIRKAIITTSKYLNIDFSNFVFDSESTLKGEEGELMKEKKRLISEIIVRESADTTIYAIIKFPELKREEGFEYGIHQENMKRFYGVNSALRQLLKAYAENNKQTESEDEEDTDELHPSNVFEQESMQMKGFLLEEDKSDEERNEKEMELQQKIMKLKKISLKPDEKTIGKIIPQQQNFMQMQLMQKRRKQQEEEDEEDEDSDE